MLPKTAELRYIADHFQRFASFSDGATWPWYRFWSLLTAKREFIITMSAGTAAVYFITAPTTAWYGAWRLRPPMALLSI